MPIGRNVHPRLPLRMQHSQIPGSIALVLPPQASMGIPQASHSPVRSMEGSFNSPTKSEILFNTQMEEIKRQRELEMFHRQQKENEDISGLVLRHEIEAERDASIEIQTKRNRNAAYGSSVSSTRGIKISSFTKT